MLPLLNLKLLRMLKSGVTKPIWRLKNAALKKASSWHPAGSPALEGASSSHNLNQRAAWAHLTPLPLLHRTIDHWWVREMGWATADCTTSQVDVLSIVPLDPADIGLLPESANTTPPYLCVLAASAYWQAAGAPPDVLSWIREGVDWPHRPIP